MSGTKQDDFSLLIGGYPIFLSDLAALSYRLGKDLH